MLDLGLGFRVHRSQTGVHCQERAVRITCTRRLQFATSFSRAITVVADYPSGRL